MWESVVGGIAGPISEQLLKAGKWAASQPGKALREVEAIEQVQKASRQYHQTYGERHGQIKVMPGLMKEPLPLDSIYTDVKFLDENCIRYFATQDELERTYRERGKRGFQVGGERQDGIAVAKSHQYLMVLGQPGVGKSTFLRKLGLEALKGKEGQFQSGQIPVFIELKSFRRSDINLKAIIAKEFEICGFPVAEAFTEAALKDGKLLILLDGLDEVPTQNMNPVIEHIEDFVTQHSNNTFVASCRTAAYHSSFKRFTDVTIADFNDEQIEQFIRRWFSTELDKEAETADRYWELLQRSENAAAKELAQTPLLLTFLCLVYDREQNLPNNRSTLYGRALSILLDEWSTQKRLERDPIYEGFHPELERELLSEIAYESFEEDRLFFSKSDITERIADFLGDTLDAPEHLDGEAVLKAIEKQQGILVERATDTYSFSHLTLQEYLTALYIVKKEQRINDLVTKHLADERWREVFLLVSGLMGRQGQELLEAIDQEAKTYISNQPKICDLLQWADRVTNGFASESKSFGNRAIAINNAVNSRITRLIAELMADAVNVDVDIDRVRAIAASTSTDGTVYNEISIESNCGNSIAIAVASYSSLLNSDPNGTIHFGIDFISDIAFINGIADIVKSASTINVALSSKFFISQYSGFIILQGFNLPEVGNLPNQLFALKDKIPQLHAAAADWVDFASELESTWLKAFELTAEAINFSEDEWQHLCNYLYANKLLLRCKDASIGISRKAWETLEARLLKLP